ncbi:sugar ABC transporter permease [Oscillospiraceae bacterium]|uniref:carbohydrate ABC transporter permease n=1 Tax=Allofournierella sp. TaxID=1940256 RepID=UPI0015A86D15|nr:sugar ABC transporter permease [Oscillospiraceae bacterium]
MANTATARAPRRGAQPAKKRSKTRSFWRRYGKHYLGLAPFVIFFAVFILWPMLYGLVMSFFDWSTRTGDALTFVGLENFKTVLSEGTQQGKRFLTSLKNLSVFVALVVPLNLLFATLISLVINQFRGRMHNFLRGAFFMPYVAPFFLATGVWLWLMSADTGLVAVLLAKIGIGEGVTWRLTPGYFTAFLIIIDLWRAIGFNMIILTAGMKNIPGDLYEASTIDGASTFQQWVHITIPMLEPVLFFVIVNCFIGAIQTYDIPWVLSNSSAVGVIGGKGAFASYPVMEIVGNVYSGKAGNLGRACAEGFVLMLIIFAITLVQIVYRGRKNKDN